MENYDEENKQGTDSAAPTLSDEEIDQFYYEMIGRVNEAVEEENERHIHPAG